MARKMRKTQLFSFISVLILGLIYAPEPTGSKVGDGKSSGSDGSKVDSRKSGGSSEKEKSDGKRTSVAKGKTSVPDDDENTEVNSAPSIIFGITMLLSVIATAIIQ